METISYMESTLLGKVYFCYMYVLYILYMRTFNCNRFYIYIYIYISTYIVHKNWDIVSLILNQITPTNLSLCTFVFLRWSVWFPLQRSFHPQECSFSFTFPPVLQVKTDPVIYSMIYFVQQMLFIYNVKYTLDYFGHKLSIYIINLLLKSMSSPSVGRLVGLS